MAKKQQKKTTDNKKQKKTKRKQTNKILNNSYRTGENLKGEDYEFSKSIRVSDDYASSYLKEVYDYENHVEYKIVLDKIMETIENDKKLREIVIPDPKAEKKKKFNSKEINLIFGKVYNEMEKEIDDSKFVNPIYMVEAISRITGLEYKRIFDYLDYEYQAVLLEALNERFDIFGENPNNMH